jgi:hypothetical protein
MLRMLSSVLGKIGTSGGLLLSYLPRAFGADEAEWFAYE